MYSIEIRDLTIDTVIGVYDWERLIKQRLVMDITLVADDQGLGSDDVNDVIDYKQVCDDIETLCHEVSANLLEYLGARIIAMLFEHYPCQKVDLRIKKPSALPNAVVGIHLRRTRKDWQA